jgi:hypothetical protein
LYDRRDLVAPILAGYSCTAVTKFRFERVMNVL